MKKDFRRFLGWVGVSLAMAAPSAWAWTPGQQLTDAQITELGKLPEYKLDGKRLRVIPQSLSGDQTTLVLNSRGVVGSSRNEVVVAGVKADARNVIQQSQPRPISVEYYEATGLTVARYADFGQAVAALPVLKTALPGAQIGLPIRFGEQVPQ